MASLTIALDDRHTRARSLVRRPLSDRSHLSSRSLSGRRTGPQQNVSIVAACRFRPLAQKENEEAQVEFLSEKTIRLRHASETQEFTLDRIFPPQTSQEAVFDFLGQSVVQTVLSGFNGTIFAYGQTGSGKTYTMLGGSASAQGLIPRCSSLLLDSLPTAKVVCSMVEIYRERLYDLLQTSLPALKIGENPHTGVFLHGLREVPIHTESDILQTMKLGMEQRTVAETAYNQMSSRSHAIFTLKVLANGRVARLNLVDLAGSERLNARNAPSEIVEDAKKINLSLSVLGTVIMALAARAEHVPYRDSKLTRVLQESLGGNCKTHVIVNCSPAFSAAEETLTSLRFAQRMKRIRSELVLVDNSKGDLQSQVAHLQLELKSTREELQRYKEKSHADISLPPITPRKLLKKYSDHDASVSFFEVSGVSRVLTENGEDWFCDSSRKNTTRVLCENGTTASPEPAPTTAASSEWQKQRESLESQLASQQREIAALKSERDGFRQSAENLSEKVKQLGSKLKSSRLRQDSDAEKRKILMLKIAADEALVTHMKARIALLTKQCNDTSKRTENEPNSWEKTALEVKFRIKESLCVIQNKQIADLEATIDQLRRSTTKLRNEALENYQKIADLTAAKCAKSHQFSEFLEEKESDYSEIVRFSYTAGSGDADYTSRKLKLAEEELQEKEKEVARHASLLRQTKEQVRGLQEALAQCQLPTLELAKLGGRFPCVHGDTQPPDDI